MSRYEGPLQKIGPQKQRVLHGFGVQRFLTSLSTMRPKKQKAHQPKLMGFSESWWEVQVSNLMSWR
jgi:hypothetical protein